ncbi:MAG: VPLPA-CTERM sorting domain-containing protein [Desulfobulbaceae bacterium]|nr:VPLPA-CTERM sorting domain-containing protein [Desulfobulbaceae bacterium]
MKKINWQKSRAITLSALLIVGITGGNALASSVSANAEVSWASLTITGSGAYTVYDPTTFTKSWSRAGTYETWSIPNFNAPSAFDDSDDRIGIVATLAESEKSNANGSSYALGKTDTTPGQQNIIANASAFAINYEDYSAMATARRDICYKVTTAGNLTFSINYTLDGIDIDASDGSGWSNILAFTDFHRYNFTTGKWDLITVGNVTKEKVSGTIEFDDYIYTESGKITFMYAAKVGEYLHFGAGVTAKASAASAVPIPGAVWLLGSGLLGIIATRRKSAQ